ncbi:MAG TPA: CAP domain-containing protein, partial [Pyrinomonadaceae bacterium]|nr:CAP domain-containing protein [Pyrinomonadaceae bacterium]
MKPSRLAARLSAVALLLFASSLFTARAQSGPSADLDALSALEKEIIQEINFARTRPREYASLLEQLRPHFNGNTYQRPGRPGLVTQEGITALEDAIRALRSANPLAPLNVSKGMCMGAGAHVKDQGPRGLTGHKGTDGSLCEERLGRFGSFQGGVGENLSFGTETARERVMTLLIDDGFATRGHRQRLLSPDFKVAGVSCGDHSQMGTMCVITLAGGFSDGGRKSA